MGQGVLTGVVEQVLVDHVRELALQGTHRLAASLAPVHTPLEVGPAGTVVGELAEGDDVDGSVEPPVATTRQPVDPPVGGRRLDRGGARVAGEVATSREPGHVAGMPDDDGSQHGPDAHDLGQTRARSGDGLGDAGVDVGQLPVDPPQVDEQLADQAATVLIDDAGL